MEQTELLGSKAEKRQFRRMVMALVVPMALQNLINVAVNAADVIMLSKEIGRAQRLNSSHIL